MLGLCVPLLDFDFVCCFVGGDDRLLACLSFCCCLFQSFLIISMVVFFRPASPFFSSVGLCLIFVFGDCLTFLFL